MNKKLLNKATFILQSALITCGGVISYAHNEMMSTCLWMVLFLFTIVDFQYYERILLYQENIRLLKEILKDRVRKH